MTSDLAGLVERRGRWILPVQGGEVTRLTVDDAFGLTIEQQQSSDRVHIRIECAFEFGTGTSLTTVDPEDTVALGPLLDLHKATVLDGYVVKDGHLGLEFGDGRVIKVAPDDRYEAFHVTGELPSIERRFELFAVPGGGIARF